MIRFIQSQIENFVLHIQINTINLPYWQLPRPHKAHPLSRVMRRIFERQSIQRLFGINLAAALMVSPFVGSLADMPYQEIPLNVVMPETVIDASITTQPRTYEVPVERVRSVSQRFSGHHPGYDISSYVGDDIKALTSGQVARIENGTLGLGKYIILDHGHGLVSVYGHLQSFSVEIGDTVVTGQKVGEVGMTGYTTGPHVHFEIHDNGVAVNPGLYLSL